MSVPREACDVESWLAASTIWSYSRSIFHWTRYSTHANCQANHCVGVSRRAKEYLANGLTNRRELSKRLSEKGPLKRHVDECRWERQEEKAQNCVNYYSYTSRGDISVRMKITEMHFMGVCINDRCVPVSSQNFSSFSPLLSNFYLFYCEVIEELLYQSV